MLHSHRYQHFALDINGCLVNIQHTVNRDGEKFLCPHCHKEMITKRGSIRQWHFAHKTDKCSYDSYLHSVAELMIMDWFNKHSSIILEMNINEKCSIHESCNFYSKEDCQRKTTVKYDLKKYYSKCTKEKGYEGFIADLLCENSKSPANPIFIEIFVTHECSQEKINSGIRIIEFEIHSEEDIINIINSTLIKECNMVRLFNFKRKVFLTDNIVRLFQKYILFPSLKSYVDRENYTCKNYNHIRKGIYEISLPYNGSIPYFVNCGGFYMAGKAKAWNDGYLKKDCQLCKWQALDFMDNFFCKLYKKCGNPKYCNENEASSCSMFREDKDKKRRRGDFPWMLHA